jgi:hypothetical protein
MEIQLTCVVCRSALYNTDQCLSEFIYHCSSPEARFWDFERGSAEQDKSKEHWDLSKMEIPRRAKKTAAQ